MGQVSAALGPWRGGGGGRGRAASLLAVAADGDPPFRSRGAGALAGIHPCPPAPKALSLPPLPGAHLGPSILIVYHLDRHWQSQQSAWEFMALFD